MVRIFIKKEKNHNIKIIILGSEYFLAYFPLLNLKET